jgi:hypothetical protein
LLSLEPFSNIYVIILESGWFHLELNQNWKARFVRRTRSSEGTGISCTMQKAVWWVSWRLPLSCWVSVYPENDGCVVILSITTIGLRLQRRKTSKMPLFRFSSSRLLAWSTARLTGRFSAPASRLISTS